MGMDVYGIGNKDAYFRANVWSWRPIHAIITEVASDFIPKKVLHGMSFNDGSGLESAEDCRKLASRIRSWMEHNTNGKSIESCPGSIESEVMESIIKATKEGLGIEATELFPSGINYSVCDDHLKEFVEFLDVCEGFKVC